MKKIDSVLAIKHCRTSLKIKEGNGNGGCISEPKPTYLSGKER
jgi:hypothetical protein